MLSTFKKILASSCLLAVSVIGVSAKADIDGRLANADRNQAIRDWHHHDHDGDNNNNGYGDQWMCATQSRGYTFRAVGRNFDEANYNVVNMCMNHPMGTYAECRYNVRCDQLTGGQTYPQPQPYPQPAPQPRLYTCQTFGGGSWYRWQSESLYEAKRATLSECRANPFSRAPECEANLQCSY